LCVAVAVNVCLFGALLFSRKKQPLDDAVGATMATIGTTTGTTRLSETSASTTGYYNHVYVSIAEEFLTSLVEKDLNKTLNLLCVYDDDISANMKAYSFFNTVDIKSYAFVESQPDKGVFLVRLNVTKSGSALFPVGTSLWNLETSTFENNVSLFKPAGKANKVIAAADDKLVGFCLSFTADMSTFKSMDDFNVLVPDTADTDDFTEFCFLLSAFLQMDDIEAVKRTDLERKAKSVLGITDVDFTKCSHYQADGDILSFGGRGGTWFYWSFSSERFTPLTKRHTVVIDYYSDSAYVLVAKTIQYVVEENNDSSLRLLSTKLLYDSGLSGAGGSV